MAVNGRAVFEVVGLFAGFTPIKTGGFLIKIDGIESGVKLRERQAQIPYEVIASAVPTVAPGATIVAKGRFCQTEMPWQRMSDFGKPIGQAKMIKDWHFEAISIEPAPAK